MDQGRSPYLKNDDLNEKPVASEKTGRTPPSYWELLPAFFSVLLAIFTLVGALSTFGVDVPVLKTAGVLGYAVTFLAAAAIALVWMLARRLHYYQKAEKRLRIQLETFAAQSSHPIVEQDERESRSQESRLLSRIPSNPDVRASFEDIFDGSLAGKASDSVAPWRAVSILSLLRDLGLISIDTDSYVSPCSAISGAFLGSMAIHLKEKISFPGDWKVTGVEADEYRSLVKVLKHAETRRLNLVREDKAEPVRKAKVALVIIKARYGGQDVYLMRNSPTWEPDAKDYWWFPGGTMAPEDTNTFEACARRNLEEKFGILGSEVTLQEVCPVLDSLVSGRLGVLTDYHYVVYYATALNTERSAVKDLFNLQSTTVRHIPHETHFTNSWRTWDELQNCRHLRADASKLLRELDSYRIAALKPTTDLEVQDA